MFADLLLFFPSAPSPPPGPAPIEPNPAETVWTLGVGGAVVSPSIAPGFALTLATVLLNAGVVVPYTSGATLDAAVWAGPGEAILFAPSVAWITPSAPSDGALTLTISPGQTATIGPGKYRLQVGVTASGVRSVCYDGSLEIADAPGSGAAPVVWCSSEDMLYRCSLLQSLVGKKGIDVAGFLLQRQEATEETKRRIILRYGPRNGFIKVRQNVMDPILDTMDIPSSIAVPPSKADLTAALNAIGGIVLEPKLRNIIARYAICLLLRRQSPGNEAYLREAERQCDEADVEFEKFQAQVVTATPIVSPSPIGAVTNFLVGPIDVILLPTGTAP